MADISGSLQLEQQAGGEERSYAVVSGGNVLETFGPDPTLDQLREAERQYGQPVDRLDLWDGNLVCTSCSQTIADRFSADIDGNLLCWDCATETGGQQQEQRNLTQTTDPAKAVLGQSGLHHKSLCDYVINVATGCVHGCKFCYVPSTPNITARQDMLEEQAGVTDSQLEWGRYLLYRDDLPERLARKLRRKQKWRRTDRGRGVVMLSSGTDCYQDRRAAQITRGCVAELIKHRIPIRILTRSPAVSRDIDLFKTATRLTEEDEGHLVRVGSSIPCLDDDQTRAIEPGAPPPSTRLKALNQLSEENIPVYVSMSPTYPTQDRDDFEHLMSKFAQINPEVVFHEPINPRGGNFDMTVEAAREAGEEDLARELEKLKDRDYWVEYSLQQMRWAEELGAAFDVDVHIWPDKQVIKAVGTEKRQKLQERREAISPEVIPEIPLPT